MIDLGSAIRLTVDGVHLYTLAYAPAALSNIDDLPALRGDDAALGALHGNQFLSKFRQNRVWTGTFFVLSDDETGVQTGTPAEQARANLDALLSVLGRSGQRVVDREMPNGDIRTCLAETSVEQVSDPTGGNELWQLNVTFDMADPLWYLSVPVVDSARSVSSSPVSFSMSNPGTVRCHRIAFNLTGANTGIRVTNNTTGEWWEATAVAVGGSKHLIVDAYDMSATNDGADVQGAITHGTQIPFMEVDPGTNSFTVTASSPGGTLTSTLTPAYW